MRAAACIFFMFVVGCTGSTGGAAQVGRTDDAGARPPADAGIISDAGSGSDAGGISEDGGATDAGTVPDGGSAPDAGPADAGPATIGTVPCGGAPALLWTRTITNDVEYENFRIAADENGNLYWFESDSLPHRFLVSTDSDGKDRYRITLPRTEAARGFAVSSGKVLLSQGATIEAYDTATGANSWSVDMNAAYPGASKVSGFVDLGDGDVAVSLDSGLYFIEIGSGKIVRAQLGPHDGYTALTSDGDGALFCSADAAGSAADYFVLDSTGAEKWRQRIAGATGMAPWVSNVPWLAITSARGISPSSDYVAVPSSWLGWVGGADLAFSIFLGDAALAPITVQAIRNHAVVATGPLPNVISFNPFAAWPFLAGNDGGHLLLVAQSWHGNPGLCFPVWPSDPWVARVDDTSISQCTLRGTQGVLSILGAALTSGRLIVGGIDMINAACGGPVNPVVVAAFALPRESLAPSGWVQTGGNGGLGSRRQAP
jgi:hypothetical protein